MLFCVSFVLLAGFMLPFGHALDKQPHSKAIRRVLSKEQRTVEWHRPQINCIGKRCVLLPPTDFPDLSMAEKNELYSLLVSLRPPVDLDPIRLLGRAVDVQRETKDAQTVAGEGKLAALLKRDRLPCYPCRGTLPNARDRNQNKIQDTIQVNYRDFDIQPAVPKDADAYEKFPGPFDDLLPPIVS